MLVFGTISWCFLEGEQQQYTSTRHLPVALNNGWKNEISYALLYGTYGRTRTRSVTLVTRYAAGYCYI